MGMFDLSAEEQQKANAAAGSTLAALFRGGAAIWGAAGKVVKFGTDCTATGLRKTADLVEKGGNATSEFCEERSLGCTAKSMHYSGYTDEEIAAAMLSLRGKNVYEDDNAAEYDEEEEVRDGRAPVIPF